MQQKDKPFHYTIYQHHERLDTWIMVAGGHNRIEAENKLNELIRDEPKSSFRMIVEQDYETPQLPRWGHSTD